MTRALAATVAVGLLAAGLSGWSGATPTAAAPADCTKPSPVTGECVTELPVPVPGSPAGTASPSGALASGQPVGRPMAPSYSCRWVAADPPDSSKAAFPEAPPDAIWQVFVCGEGQYILGTGTGTGWRWLPPGGGPPSPPTPPAPGVVATMVFARVKAEMVAPSLGSDPPPGVAAVVNTPVFVEVTNWQPEIVDRDCVLGVCVSMTASPSLVFDPGDGSEAVSCEPPGSRYDPALPLMEQAQGACAHVYRLRTGAEGRPSEWPGLVTVTWNVSWTSNVGASGTYAPLSFSTGLPRAVEEVSTVVVEGSS